MEYVWIELDYVMCYCVVGLLGDGRGGGRLMVGGWVGEMSR